MGFPTFGLLLQGLRLLSGFQNKGYYGSCKGYGYYKDSIVGFHSKGYPTEYSGLQSLYKHYTLLLYKVFLRLLTRPKALRLEGLIVGFWVKRSCCLKLWAILSRRDGFIKYHE